MRKFDSRYNAFTSSFDSRLDVKSSNLVIV